MNEEQLIAEGHIVKVGDGAMYDTKAATWKLAQLGRTAGDGEPLHITTVRYLAQVHGVGQKFSRVWWFSEEDLQVMADLPRQGRPAITISEPSEPTE